MNESTTPTIRQVLVAAVLRLYPFYSGNAKLANNVLVKNLVGPSENMAFARIPGGEVLVRLNEFVGRTVYFTGNLEKKVGWLCSRIVRPGDTVIDIGANVGVVTVLLSSLVGEKGKVFAFEPNPTLHDMLDRTMERNRITNVFLSKVALGDKEGNLSLCFRSDNVGAGSLVYRYDSAQIVTVPVTTLSSRLRSERLGSIRLIKIDAEGFEPEILSGAMEILMSARPDAILFELHAGASISNHPTVRILREAGYSFFSISRSVVSMRVKRFDPSRYENDLSINFLASPSGKCYEEIASLITKRSTDASRRYPK
jgi:FkbM family methyltransferase